jgi:hypothetical protein
MSSNSVVYNNGQQVIVNFDVSKIFVWNNRYIDANHTNSTYDDVQLYAGTLMGRVSATKEVVPCDTTATDGSQYPIGVLAEDRLVAAGDVASLSICVEGDVVKDKIILSGTDTMDTVLSGKILYDRIGSDSVGIKLVESTEMTGFDNQ